MGKRGKTALTGLLLAFAAVAGLAIFHRPEPQYQGRRLSDWLQQYNQIQDLSQFSPIDEAIRAIGTNAVPRLLSDIQRGASPSNSQKFVARWCPRWVWLRSLVFGEDTRSAPALMAFRALGSEAKPALPGLKKLLEDSQTMDMAAQGFFFIGPGSIPTLEDACRCTNIMVRVKAALMVAKLKSSLRNMFGYSWHKSPLTGGPLLSVGDASSIEGEQEMIDALAEGLQNPDPAIRRANAEAVLAPVASSTLVGLMDRANAQVRTAAREVLRQMDNQRAVTAGVQ